MPDTIEKAFKRATSKLKKVGHNIDALPKSVASFLMVYSAQGVIGNGGYYYFFEHDWPNDPPYSKFIDAYLEIGCSSQSNDLARVVSTFPFDNPHLNKNARNKYMDENYDEKKYEVKDWGDALCGDDEVWEKLKAYYLKNIDDFV